MNSAEDPITPRLSILRKVKFPELDDELFEAFMAQCQLRGLSPWVDQVYPKVLFDNVLKRRYVKMMLGIEGFRIIAHRTGVYAGCEDNQFTYDENGKIASASTTVYKFVSGHRCAFPATVRMSEYVGIPSDIDTAFREQMPHMWLGKCAESAALRKAFPEELGGLYTPEEMQQADSRRTSDKPEPEEQPAYDDDGSQLPESERAAVA